ncbi:MAG: DNA polymerase III subunit gamma/tau, partial [Acidobacteriaceae bacterium]|nr:DNA polymerase III subunit gamma/tau [Acidobacteriaceae bacterium]
MYQVIARKYRPQSFAELLGQEHVQKTLTNAIETRRIAHGYIFSGQRGTGKTTVARILARCLNCIHGPTATPCGVCSSCVEISAGNSVDVIEIDAASNRGINEMREIRENVRYRPARDRYKVFIIDEAHQITKEAFNALLKTLEEPPEWVVFLLCTTEAYEIPNTIASRCQHFAFRSVDFQELIARMRFIAEQEDIEASEEVLSVIAQAGEGSVRDSLSALDQAIACCGRTLSVEEIRALLGVFGTESLKAVADAVSTQDGARMIEIVYELETSGQSLQHFCRELARYWRNVLVAKIAGKPTRLIAASGREQEAFLDTSAQFSEEDLTRYLNITLELYKTLQTSLQPRLHLELGLIKLVHAGRLQPIEEALAVVGSMGGAAAERGAPPSPAPPALSASSRPAVTRPPTFQAPIPARRTTPADTATVEEKPTNATTGDLKRDLHDALRSAGLTFSADAIQN